MYFMSDTAPITLHTDASDYGVGEYLFQTVDGVDQPIAFVSKSLTSAQLRWSVIHMSTKEFNTHKDYLPGSFVLCIIKLELLLHVCIHTGEVQ